MAVTISGRAFYDLNHNGQYDAGEPGLSEVCVVLRSGSKMRNIMTAQDGRYSFTISRAGMYCLSYESCEFFFRVTQAQIWQRMYMEEQNLVIDGEQLAAYHGADSEEHLEACGIQCGSCAELVLTITGDLRQVAAGSEIAYQLEIANCSETDILAVQLSDRVLEELQNMEYSVDRGESWNAWEGSYSWEMIQRGACLVVMMRAMVAADVESDFVYTAHVSAETRLCNTAGQTAAAWISVRQSADLMVSLMSGEEAVNAGDIITYTAQIKNNGPDAAEQVIFQDMAAPDLQDVMLCEEGKGEWSLWCPQYNLCTMSAGESRRVLIRGTVNPMTTGVIHHTVSVCSATPDPDLTNNRASNSLQVHNTADLAVFVMGETDCVSAGGRVFYQIVITNAGPAEAKTTWLSAVIPKALRGAEYSLDDGATYHAWESPICTGDMARGELRRVLFRASVTDMARGTIVFTVALGSSTTGTNPSAQTNTVQTRICDTALLRVTKTANLNVIEPGQEIIYQILVENDGTATAERVFLLDAVSVQLDNPMVSLDQGATWQNWCMPLALGRILSGMRVKVLLRGTLRAGITDAVMNQAMVTSPSVNTNWAQTTDQIVVPVTELADVSVNMSALSGHAVVGASQEIRVLVANSGPSAAQGAIVKLELPIAAVCTEFSVDEGATWQLWENPYLVGTLDAGSDREIWLRIRVETTDCEQICMKGEVIATTTDPNIDNNVYRLTLPVRGAADLLIDVCPHGAEAIVGEELTYAVTVENRGPCEACEVQVSIMELGGFTGAQISCDNGKTWNDLRNPICLNRLGNAARRCILVRGRVEMVEGGTLVLVAMVESDTIDICPTNNVAASMLPIVAAADLAILHVGTPCEVLAGEQLVYTTLVSNLGPSQAEGVEVLADFPKALSDVVFSADNGFTWQPWVNPYPLGNLPSGESRLLLLKGSVTSGSGSKICNTVRIQSATTDPNPNNNEITTETSVKCG